MNQTLIFDRSYINGAWTTEGTASFEVRNPANGKIVATLMDGNTALTEKAISAADQAFKFWRNTTAKYRANLLEQWNDLILANTNHLAEIMTLECGKPLRESKGEVAYGASFIKWFAEEGKRIYGDIIPPTTQDRRIIVIKQPVGVVAAMTPWNFPLAMITRKVAPALAAGCSVVIRPSEETPLTALALVHLAEKAGFPAGVINVVIGTDASAMGKVLCNSDLVKKISFTGSTQTGQILMAQCAQTLKKLSLELGGNAPFIVFEDANISQAVEGAILSKFRNAGQTCVCVNRILVHDKVYAEFTEQFIQGISELNIGDGFSKNVHIGPMIHARAIESARSFVQDAKEKGGVILTGGNVINDYFFEPTIIGNAHEGMRCFSEEIFGPIAPIYKFSTDAEAIRIANNTIYGLASYFYSENISRCWKIAEALEYGMVGINEGILSTEVAPFGGIKLSGQGREGSKYGIEDYLDIKYMCFGNIL
jgi:succinate-semialdehyde dehydrogenase/glutarate-semialdehyde dehydrogenase